MEVRNEKYKNYQTVRQWAKRGYLPNPDAEGVKLWANELHQNSYLYFSPDQVAPVSDKQLYAFFQAERDRRNQKARERRRKQREQAIRDQKHQEQEALEQAIRTAVSPLENRITELCKIISELTEQLRPESTDGPTYVIDTETTGLDPIRDELLQVSVLDLDGQVIYNSHFRPCATSWPNAEAVNHITPEMVKESPSISQEITFLSGILSKASTIIGYNTGFDLDFVRFNGVVIAQNVEIVDVMSLFAPIYGEWDEKHENYRWKSLSVCADYYGYDWGKHPEQAHDSLADCRATLYCYQKIMDDEQREMQEHQKLD